MPHAGRFLHLGRGFGTHAIWHDSVASVRRSPRQMAPRRRTAPTSRSPVAAPTMDPGGEDSVAE